MKSEDSNYLHPLTAEILQALASMEAEPVATPTELESMLGRFVCGSVTDLERTLIIGALTFSADLRERMLEMRDELRLAASSLGSRPSVLEKDPILAMAVKSTLASMVDTYANWKAVCSEAFSREQNSGQRGVSFKQVLRQFEESLRPLPISATRGSGSSAVIKVEPGVTRADLSVVIDDEGNLDASAVLDPPYENQTDLALFALGHYGAWVYLGTSEVSAAQWNLRVERFSDHISYRPGALASSHFSLIEGQGLPSRNAIRLQGPDEGDEAAAIWLNVTKRPAILKGRFTIGVEIPDEIRASLSGGILSSALELGPIPYVIGAWNVDSLPNSNQWELTAPLPDVGDCEFELLSAVSLSYRLPV